MSTFTNEELQELKTALRKKAHELEKAEEVFEERALKGFSGDETGEISNRRRHSADLASSEADREVNLKMAEHDIVEIKQIERAIYKIDHGKYGKCEGCGGNISRSRLMALPEALHCIGCKTEIEKANKLKMRPHEVDSKRVLIDPVS